LSNPLLNITDLPPFTAIQPEHITPAVDHFLKQCRQELKELFSKKSNSYVELMEGSYKILEPFNRAWGAISHLKHVVSSDELREAYNSNLPKVTQFFTELSQNKSYYNAYKSILPSELRFDQARALEQTLLDFELSGVALEGEARERSQTIMSRLSELTSQFSDAVLDATMSWTKHITDKEVLKGLPESALALLAQNAQQREKDGYLLTLEFPSYLPIMLFAEDRNLRKEVCLARQTLASEIGPDQGKYDNTQRMNEIMSLRQELAQLLGFENYAAYSIKKKMAKDCSEVMTFLEELLNKSRSAADNEVEDVKVYAKQRDNINELNPWDLPFYRERIREDHYQLSDEELKPYFPIEKVIDGMFKIVSELFDVEILEIIKFESWHKDVRFYEIRQAGEQIARFFLDPFARQHKQGGAWMDNCRDRKKLSQEELHTPIAYLVCNFTPPIGDKPSLLTHDEVTTLFHEFGHGLHHMLTKIEDPHVAGINGVEWDAVELPSQFLENWCWEKETLPLISSHYETGEPLPEDLLQKLLKIKTFQGASMMLRQLEFSIFDFRLHMEYGQESFPGIAELVKDVQSKTAVIPSNPENRFQNSFSHIFAGGYAAGYYSYKWAEVLSADAFSLFEEEGIMNKTTGQKFIENILSCGSSKSAADMFRAFRGRDPKIDALLRHSGITSEAS
jgi:oligopeptidase A